MLQDWGLSPSFCTCCTYSWQASSLWAIYTLIYFSIFFFVDFILRRGLNKLPRLALNSSLVQVELDLAILRLSPLHSWDNKSGLESHLTKRTQLPRACLCLWMLDAVIMCAPLERQCYQFYTYDRRNVFAILELSLGSCPLRHLLTEKQAIENQLAKLSF